MEGRHPRSGDGTLLCPAQFPGAPHPLATNDLIEINSTVPLVVLNVFWPSWQMNRCSFCEWIPILPLPVWPLAGQFLLGQNVVVGSMTLLLAVRGNIATRSMSGPPFALQLHRTTVWCGATFY